VQSLEASSLAFVGHRWGSWRASAGIGTPRAKITRQELISAPTFLRLQSSLLTRWDRHCRAGVQVCGISAFGGGSPLHFLFCLGCRIVRLLALRVRCRSDDHGQHVEGASACILHTALTDIIDHRQSTGATYSMQCPPNWRLSSLQQFQDGTSTKVWRLICSGSFRGLLQ
jgi:hypothetical protein